MYSIIGIFRRTSSGYYFYQQPCAMNKWCFFYTAFGLILYTPQLAAASRNKYGIGVRETNIDQREKSDLFEIDIHLSSCGYIM